MSKILLYLICAALWLQGCATAHLHPDEPMSLLSTLSFERADRDSSTSRRVLTTLLGLDKQQRSHFNQMLDRFKAQHQSLQPVMRRYQQTVRSRFGSARFSAAELRQHWRTTAGALENKQLREGSAQLFVFWQSLSPAQRKKVAGQLARWQKQFNGGAEKALQRMRPQQEKRLAQLVKRAQLNSQQQHLARALLVSQSSVKQWQERIQGEMKKVLSRLAQPNVSTAVLLQQLKPFYDNGRVLQVQLEKLEALHRSLSPEQRQIILKNFTVLP